MLIVRPAETDDAPGIARVHVDAWQKAYRGIVPQDYLNALNVQNRTIGWVRLLERQSGLYTMVSEDEDGRIVGFASGGALRHRDPRYKAEISSLYVTPQRQRRGHGRRLFLALANRLAERGLNGLFVWVLSDNRAARLFYEKLGGEAAAEVTRDFAGVPLRETGYGWPETPRYG